MGVYLPDLPISALDNKILSNLMDFAIPCKKAQIIANNDGARGFKIVPVVPWSSPNKLAQ